jgi:ribosomal protein S18 acetylase RimI-like enzyme
MAEAWKPGAVDEHSIACRPLVASDLERIGEIDRTERIELLFVQRGTGLDERVGAFDASPWLSEGDGEHSVAHQRAYCERHLAAGGIALGAFAGERLVGIGLVTPHIRPRIAQLAFLHVSNGFRGRGIGVCLLTELETLARERGDAELVVSATPSANTVRFYLRRGFGPMAEPLPELYALEPEDVHMRKTLRGWAAEGGEGAE